MKTAVEILELARATPNRGRSHIFLGSPLSDGADKTVVEAGNGYSPGIRTCGISVWIASGDNVFTPDRLSADAIEWTIIAKPGDAPVSVSSYDVGALHVIHRLAHCGGEGASGLDVNEIDVRATDAASATLYVVVKDFGPSGARLEKLTWDAATQTLEIAGGLRLVCDSQPAVCSIVPPDEQCDSCAVALAFSIQLSAGGVAQIRFKTVHGFESRDFGRELAEANPLAKLTVGGAFARVKDEWQRALPARVFAPDPRVALTWERCAHHILAAMECGLPRIGAHNYPVFWIRDCVIVLRALDLFGRGDLARVGNEYLAPMIFGGGFGAEADAPGEGIFALVSHARMSGDTEWLREVFPQIRKRIEWLTRMLNATQPIRTLSENRLPKYHDTPGVNVVCLPARNGLIHGRMDWHCPDFYINCWAQCGFAFAADAAEQLGEAELAHRWRAEARRIDAALATHLLPQYGNDRDPAVAPHPTGALREHSTELREKFSAWYRRVRLTTEGQRRAEPLWTYFEAAQAHNALRLGLVDEAWTTLNGMLAAPGPWDVSAYGEGDSRGHENIPYRNNDGVRGWLNPENAQHGNMPHNWTSAELICALRSVFVAEENAELLLGRGVPREWLEPGKSFGCNNLPTEKGAVSYRVTIGADSKPQLEYHGPSGYRLEVRQ